MREVKITWFGHSMFLFDNSKLKVLIDPFDESVGYPLPEIDADLVLVSHDHCDHNNVHLAKNPGNIVKECIAASAGQTKVEGFCSFHDNVGGVKRGGNTIYKWNMSGVTFVHLGDFGEAKLSDQQLEYVRGASILMLPVGGGSTIGAKEARVVVNQVKPAIAIPMHYKTEVSLMDLHPVDGFLACIDCFRYCLSSVVVSALSFPVNTEVWVLEPATHDGH